MTRYCIVSVSRNARPWIEASLQSIAEQKDQQFDVCVVDDASTDGSAEIIRERAEHEGWACSTSDVQMGAMFNQCMAIDILAPAPDDVIVIVDGDDRLAHPDVLNRLEQEYQDPRVQLTYGSYRPDPPSATCPMAMPYPDDVIRRRTFRTKLHSVGVLYNHLRTFRYGPFSQLDRDLRFRWPNGDWYDCCPDGAIMLPLLEMVGPDHRFIPDVLYIYTSSNPTSEWRERPRRIDETYNRICGLPRVKPWRHHARTR